jgi:hypothetical protein
VYLNYDFAQTQNKNTSKRVMLKVTLLLLLCPSKNDVAFKITIELVINKSLLNFDQIMILKATSLL